MLYTKPLTLYMPYSIESIVKTYLVLKILFTFKTDLYIQSSKPD